jgi:hypothetical protein
MCIPVTTLRVGSVSTRFESSRIRTFMNLISSRSSRSQPLEPSVQISPGPKPELEQVHLTTIQPDLTPSDRSGTLDRVPTGPIPITDCNRLGKSHGLCRRNRASYEKPLLLFMMAMKSRVLKTMWLAFLLCARATTLGSWQYIPP